MKTSFAAIALLLAGTAVALAGPPATHEEAKRLSEALVAEDCYGGEMEREDDGPARFEVDEVICADGKYKFWFDADFKILDRRRD